MRGVQALIFWMSLPVSLTRAFTDDFSKMTRYFTCGGLGRGGVRRSSPTDEKIAKFLKIPPCQDARNNDILCELVWKSKENN